MWLRSGQMKMGAAILADSNLAVRLQTTSETSTRRCLQVGTMSVVELRLTPTIRRATIQGHLTPSGRAW